MTDVYAYGACIILGLLAIFQLALVFGAPLGKFAWGGGHTVLPTRLRIGSIISIVLYTLFATVILNKAGSIHTIESHEIITIATWILTAYFFIGIIMNGISRSKSERAVMIPTAAALTILSFLVAIK